MNAETTWCGCTSICVGRKREVEECQGLPLPAPDDARVERSRKALREAAIELLDSSTGTVDGIKAAPRRLFDALRKALHDDADVVLNEHVPGKRAEAIMKMVHDLLMASTPNYHKLMRRIEREVTKLDSAPKMDVPTFKEAWARMEAQGYRYGEDALEQVRFGWELHAGAVNGTLPGSAPEGHRP